MACIMKNKLENGVISYTIQVKAKDPTTNKYKVKTMTWRKPPDMTEYQAKRELDKMAYDFEDKVRKQVLGIIGNGNNKPFDEYTKEWLTRLKKTASLHHYLHSKAISESLIEHFGKINLSDITPTIIQKFFDKLQEHQVVKEYAVMKKDLRRLLQSKRIRPKDLLEKTGVGDYTYQAAQRGDHVRVKSAQDLCKGLGVNYDEYFETFRSTKPYARESLLKYKRCLSVILASAKRQRLIDHNFASSEYLLPLYGDKQEIEILNDTEAKKLKEALDTEENPRWKISMYIILFMGLRRGELAGLEWKDIDFENKTMSIERSCYDITGYGLITKVPKTPTSIRCLTMPNKLVEELKIYREWYLDRKSIFGDLWDNCDRVMISDMGTPIHPNIYRVWLKKILKRAGMKDVTLHSLRHTNITLQISAGVDLKTVSVRAGHARTSTTSDIYSHFIKSSDSHASKIIDNIFEENNA